MTRPERRRGSSSIDKELRPRWRFETVDGWYNLDTGQSDGIERITYRRTAFEGVGERDSLAKFHSQAVIL